MLRLCSNLLIECFKIVACNGVKGVHLALIFCNATNTIDFGSALENYRKHTFWLLTTVCIRLGSFYKYHITQAMITVLYVKLLYVKRRVSVFFWRLTCIFVHADICKQKNYFRYSVFVCNHPIAHCKHGCQHPVVLNTFTDHQMR